MQIEVRGEVFELLPERALFWPRHRILAIADLHLGKAEIFQRQGLWLPSQANEDDLKVLTTLVTRLDVQKVLFLGDLVHSAHAVAGEIENLFSHWSLELHSEVTVLLGNHDRGLDQNWPASWSQIHRAESWQQDGFIFQHDLPASLKTRDPFHWVGHLHPMVVLNDGTDRLRLPCFTLTQNHGILPAFSRLAGGYNVRPTKEQKIFASAGDRMIQIGRVEPLAKI